MSETIEMMEQDGVHQADLKPITTPLSDLMTKISASVKEERERVKSEEYPRIYEKYGKMSEHDAAKIYDAEKLLAECENCTGLPCQSRAKGWIPVIKGATKFGVDIPVTPCKFTREKRLQEKIGKAFKMAKMPSRYIDKTFADYEVTADNAQAVKVAKEIVENPHFGMYVYGKPGTGKTFLAAIIAQELIHKGKTVIFGDVPSVLDDLKSTFDGGGEKSLSELMRMLASVDMLVLDDLGTEVPTEWAVERLYKIVNDRYNEAKPLIITSNFKPDTVAERMNHPKKKDGNYTTVTGDRIISRLLQICKGITIKGKDRRF